MGIRIGTLFFIFWVTVANCYSSEKKEFLEHGKQLAYCECLSFNYSKIDSLFTNYLDVSLSSVFMSAQISAEAGQQIIEFTDSVTAKFYSLKNHTTDEVGAHANIIALTCLDFYRSKLLQEFVLFVYHKQRKSKS